MDEDRRLDYPEYDVGDDDAYACRADARTAASYTRDIEITVLVGVGSY